MVGGRGVPGSLTEKCKTGPGRGASGVQEFVGWGSGGTPPENGSAVWNRGFRVISKRDLYWSQGGRARAHHGCYRPPSCGRRASDLGGRKVLDGPPHSGQSCASHLTKLSFQNLTFTAAAPYHSMP